MNSAAFFTGITYHVCGHDVPVYIKTGLYLGQIPNGHEFKDINNQGAVFGVHGDYFRPENIELEHKDRTSILLFFQDGPLFLIYNHSNEKYQIWPETVSNLGDKYFWKANLPQQMQLKKCLDQYANNFISSPFLKSCLEYLRNLYGGNGHRPITGFAGN